ncbi:MAG: ABC transporter permease [Candidatus Pelethousia sp.]|nr:ABC transporter permease [Candidatus Pelethousia sp.]
MVKYVLKRLIFLIPIVVGIAFIIFTIMNLTPGDPARFILGPDATAEACEQLTEELGLNRPFFVRFFDYVYKAATQLDFGNSYRTQKPVFDEIFTRFPVSLKLSMVSIGFAVLVGIPLGVFSAVHQYSIPDQLLRIGSMFFVAMPPFWFAMMLILVFALNLHWAPTSGNATWQCYILPMITLGMPYGGKILRITRSTMLEVIRQDYITTAKAKGVPQNKIIYGHALKNALLPVITTVATSFGGLLGGAIITESVFNMSGLGSLIVLSIKLKDTPTVMASIILLAVMFTIIMLIVDLVYAFIDPRIKAKYARG